MLADTLGLSPRVNHDSDARGMAVRATTRQSRCGHGVMICRSTLNASAPDKNKLKLRAEK